KSIEDELAALLVASDEALAEGGAATSKGEAATPPELQSRLERGRECLRLLHEVRPRGHAEAAGAVGAGSDHPISSDAAALALREPELPNRGRQFGRFQLERVLGRGGFGVVLLAHDPRLGRLVALKLPRLNALTSDELRRRFQQEARAAAALDHPNIIPILETGEVGPICYIASTYCPGMSLATWLKQNPNSVPYVEAARLVAMLADAVQHAHERGIIHRDLKPANVLLQSADGKARIDEATPGTAPGSQLGIVSLQSAIPRITDFGLAKVLADDGQATQTGAVLGTPSYMAPEQAGGQTAAVSQAADIYALGAILYELLTGRPPF